MIVGVEVQGGGGHISHCDISSTDVAWQVVGYAANISDCSGDGLVHAFHITSAATRTQLTGCIATGGFDTVDPNAAAVFVEGADCRIDGLRVMFGPVGLRLAGERNLVTSYSAPSTEQALVATGSRNSVVGASMYSVGGDDEACVVLGGDHTVLADAMLNRGYSDPVEAVTYAVRLLDATDAMLRNVTIGGQFGINLHVDGTTTGARLRGCDLHTVPGDVRDYYFTGSAAPEDAFVAHRIQPVWGGSGIPSVDPTPPWPQRERELYVDALIAAGTAGAGPSLWELWSSGDGYLCDLTLPGGATSAHVPVTFFGEHGYLAVTGQLLWLEPAGLDGALRDATVTLGIP